MTTPTAAATMPHIQITERAARELNEKLRQGALDEDHARDELAALAKHGILVHRPPAWANVRQARTGRHGSRIAGYLVIGDLIVLTLVAASNGFRAITCAVRAPNPRAVAARRDARRRARERGTGRQNTRGRERGDRRSWLRTVDLAGDSAAAA
jgi:hypothetical protein